MDRYDCGAIPVVNNLGKMIGMITDRDITVRLTSRGVDPNYAAVGDCMTRESFACHHDDRLIDCMRSMSRHQVRRIPILNERDQVVGIISQSDLARHAVMNRETGERRAFSNVVCAVSEPTSEPFR
jgi:CBS domain-containing protein